MKALFPVTLALAVFGSVCQAADEVPGADQLVSKLEALHTDLKVESLSPAPVAGLFQVELVDGAYLYATADAQHLLIGDLYEFKGKVLVNLTEAYREERRLELLAGVAEDDMIVFSPDGKPKTSVAVFTDVDCGYCRKLHMEMDQINALGIEVRYLAFPRAGPGSRTYEKIVSAWCSTDPNDAITTLKLGKNIPDRTCANPVSDQYALGKTMGVTGTPALITETGKLVPGYLPAPDLAEALGL